MSKIRDGRAKRTAKVVQFLSRLERDRKANLQNLVQKAKMMEMEGFENINWKDSKWTITGGRLIKLTGKNSQSTTFGFLYSPKNGGGKLDNEWSEVAKALFVLRFHRDNQSAPSQRNFITAISYVAFSAKALNLDLVRLTPEILDNACRLISKHYKETTAYNIQKAVGEFAGHCDANGLCRVLFKYKYVKMRRPEKTSGVGYKRLDDKAVLETKNDKLIEPEVFTVLGELYKNVPKDHKYRFYILVLTLLLCTGRRFSELSLMPFQKELKKDFDGNEYLEYFPRKTTLGNTFTPKRKIYMPTVVLEIVRDVIKEINVLCSSARDTAKYIFEKGDADLRFLSDVSEDEWLYREDLEKLGLPPTLVDITGWIRKNDYALLDENYVTKQKHIKAKPYTFKEGVAAYCRADFEDTSHEVIHIDQDSNKYYLKDMMLIRNLGLSTGFYASWDVTQCTHSMMTTFLRYLPELAEEFVSTQVKLDFTSHHFRHTLNTLLDEGGLSDVMQTEWFGRRNPADTKAYQHTSPEKRALMVREDIKKGRVKGMIADQLKHVPVSQQDLFLKLRVVTVHDVGVGGCIHNYTQTACERHLQCAADCKDYIYVKNDLGRLSELKRQYAFTMLAHDAALEKSRSSKPKKSIDILAHNKRKLRVLSEQLKFNNVDVKTFDYKKFIDEFIKNQEEEAVDG